MKGLSLIAKAPSDLYHEPVSYVSYTNLTTNDLTLVIYFQPKVFRPGSLFRLSKITILPITWPKLGTTLQINDGQDVYVARNLQSTLSQIIKSVDDCDKIANFYTCPNSGVHYKDNDRCILAILDKKQDVTSDCPFTAGGPAMGMVKQIAMDTFVIFTANEISRLEVSCNTKDLANPQDRVNYRLNENTIYKIKLNPNCMADTGNMILTSLLDLETPEFMTLTFDFIISKDLKNLSESLKEYETNKVVNVLQGLNTGSTYHTDYLANKLELKRIADNKQNKAKVWRITIVCSLLVIGILVISYLAKKLGCFSGLGSFCKRNELKGTMKYQKSVDTLETLDEEMSRELKHESKKIPALILSKKLNEN